MSEPPRPAREDAALIERTQVSSRSGEECPADTKTDREGFVSSVSVSSGNETALVTGQLLDDRFEIRAVAGTGGMGVVYRAHDRELGSEAAVKVLRSGAEHERFEREVRLLAALEHENIVRYISHGTLAGGELYLAMEWLEGHDLASHLQRFRLSVRQAVQVTLQLTRALSVAHHLGVVHRDVNPRNIFLVGGGVGRVKVLDFGVARPPAATEHLTSAGSPIGTPGYMAPEQAQGALQITAAADVFSVGCVLFECLTGERAFSGRTLMELFARILVDDVPRVSSRVATVPPELDALVANMLHKVAEARPRNAREVVEALERLGPLSDTPDEEPLAPHSEGAITDVEQRLSSIILISPVAELAFRGLLRRALEHGVHPQRLADGSVLAVLSNRGSATEQVAAAARSALDLRASLHGAVIAVATGRAVTSGEKPVGEAIERASAALLRVGKRRARGEHSDESACIFLDQVTAGLLDARFDVRSTDAGLLLLGTRPEREAVRTVLGRRTRCIGRRRELTLLQSTLEECVEDSVARAVLVTGPSGIGKTRLAHEFLRQARIDLPDAAVFSARGEPTGIGSPFAVLGRAIRGFAGVAEAASLEVQQAALLECLARSVPPETLPRVHQFLCELVAVPLPEAESPELRAARFDHVLAGDQMLRAFEDWLSRECQARPVLMVLDDFHWGDLPTVKFLDAALRNLSELPLMLVALGQPEVHEMFPDLWSRRGLFELRLSGLSRRSSESLVRDVLGRGAEQEVVQRVVEKAQGNPFWIEELIRAESEAEQAPEAIVLLAQARLERLASDARRVLRAASVLGRRFWEGGLRALLGSKVDALKLDQLLASLEESEVVTSRALNMSPLGREFEFSSSLLRDAAYGTLTSDDRERAHLAAAEWLEGMGDADAVALAEHFKRGGARERALLWYQKAAEQALSGNDWQVAREMAVRAKNSGADGATLSRLLLVEAEASKWLGDNASALERSLEATSASERGGPQWCRASGEAVATAGKLGRADAYTRLAADLLGTEPNTENLAPLMIALSRGATQLVLCGELELAGSLLDRVEQLCQRGEPTPTALAWVLEARAVRAGAMDNASERVELAAAAAEQFELAGDLRNACLQRISVGFACVEIGAYERARTQLSEGLEVATRMALSNSIPIARAQLGRALSHVGALEPARALLHEAILELDRHGNTRLEGAVRGYLATLLLDQGLLEEARRIAEESVRVLETVPSMLPSVLAILAMVHLAKQEPEQALVLARRANEGVSAHTRLNFGEASVRLSLVLALLANGAEAEAKLRLSDAHRRLQSRAALISDPELKELFLTAVPENARTLRLALELS